jgi:hypothetical protein
MPYHMWKDLEFHRLADELGVLLDVDPRSADHIDFTRGRGRLRNKPSDTLRTDLLKTFPFAQHSVSDVVLMIEKIGFSLG